MPRNGSAWRSLGPVRTRNRPSFSLVSVTALAAARVTALAACVGVGGASTAQPEIATVAATPSTANSHRIGRTASNQHGAIVLTERRRRFRRRRPLPLQRQGHAAE